MTPKTVEEPVTYPIWIIQCRVGRQRTWRPYGSTFYYTRREAKLYAGRSRLNVRVIRAALVYTEPS